MLFAFAAGLVARRRVAWDCATGSGQAAAALTEYFERVTATDRSAAQIAHAVPHPRVEYRVATAEASGLPAASVDLVTVAQALHWFDLDGFYAEVRRVAAPGGALAVWTYGDPVMADRGIDAALQQFNQGTMGPYWPTDRGQVGEQSRLMPFPFTEIDAPTLDLERDWTLAELAGYLRTWSSTGRYVAAHGADPVTDFVLEVAPAWGDSETPRSIRWPLTVRAGRVHGGAKR